jgi:hypothetical protein
VDVSESVKAALRNPNDEIRMTNQIRMTNVQMTKTEKRRRSTDGQRMRHSAYVLTCGLPSCFGHSSFEHSNLIRHSNFDIRISRQDVAAGFRGRIWLFVLLRGNAPSVSSHADSRTVCGYCLVVSASRRHAASPLRSTRATGMGVQGKSMLSTGMFNPTPLWFLGAPREAPVGVPNLKT